MADENVDVIPGSRRPDGTMRKPTRVKKGYVPPEEQAKFREVDTTPIGTIGADPVDDTKKPMTAAAKKNAKKKEKKEAAKADGAPPSGGGAVAAGLGTPPVKQCAYSHTHR